jgi:hypothetical protein
MEKCFIQVCYYDMRTQEIVKQDFYARSRKRTLMNRISALREAFNLDEYLMMVTLPSQELPLREIRGLLPAFLEYSPLIVTPKGADAKEGCIIFRSEGETKVFSLGSGKFESVKMLNSEELYTIVSANNPYYGGYSVEHGYGLTKHALKLLDETRPAWEGKLRTVYTDRNTIHKDLTPGEYLPASDADMKREALWRMHLLDLCGEPYNAFSDENELSVSEQRYVGRCDDGTDTPVFGEDFTIHYGKGAWTLFLSRISGTSRAIVKNLESDRDLLVYHLQRTERDFGVDFQGMQAMLYVGRNMDEWEYAQSRITADGMVDAYVIPLGAEWKPLVEAAEFGSIGVKEIIGCLFRVY